MPSSACSALPRLASSLRCFQGMTSGTTCTRKVLAVQSALSESRSAVSAASASAPYRPITNTPVTGAMRTITSPGDRCTAGIHTVTPKTRTK